MISSQPPNHLKPATHEEQICHVDCVRCSTTGEEDKVCCSSCVYVYMLVLDVHSHPINVVSSFMRKRRDNNMQSFPSSWEKIDLWTD